MEIKNDLVKLIVILLSCIFSILTVKIFFNHSQNFEEFGLGEGTSSHYAVDEKHQLIHVNRLSGIEDTALVNGWNERGRRNIFLCLGNSQTHGINKFHDGEKTYNGILYDRFKKDSLDILTESLPNANLQEHYLLFDYWRHRLPVKYLLLPVFMDDLRENDIREIFMPLLFSSKYQIKDGSEIAKRINTEIEKSNSEQFSQKDLAALKQTVQEKSELFLNEKLENSFDIWKFRPEVRGELFMSLYKWRNSIFSISAQTKRKMIPSYYRDNIKALRAILNDACKENIKVLVYIPPIRMDIEIPYDKIEYENFKKEIESIALEYKQKFCNVENVVPGEFWGLKESSNTSNKLEYDFMHFQFKGHLLLANALEPEIKKIIKNDF